MSGWIMVTTADFKAASSDTLREIKREAEAYLAAQLQAGIAADQRAMSFVGLMAAAAVVVAGGGGSLLLADKPNALIGWICLVIAIGFAAAMGLAAVSARPVNFWYSGSMPIDWQGDIASNIAYSDSLPEQLVNLNQRLKENNATLKHNARVMFWAIIVAWTSLFLGGLAGVQALVEGPSTRLAQPV